MSRIYRRVPPCDPSLVTAAGEFSVADLHEAMDLAAGRSALFSPAIRPLNPGLRIAGQAATVSLYPGDALLLHKAVQLVRPGQVLVVSNGGSAPQVMFAELVALAARAAGAAGAVVEGCIRDTAALREIGFPVWSSGVFSAHVGKAGPGSVNTPIVCAGVHVGPGDIIVADDDGAVCIPPRLMPRVLKRAGARAERERTIRAAIDRGERLFDLLNLQPAIDDAGIEEIDDAWSG